MRTLDQMPHSHHDTAFIFYVRAGKSTKEEIYASALGRNRNQLDTNFVDFLFSLGETTPIDTHSYWSGNVKSSYRIGLQKTKGTNFTLLEIVFKRSLIPEQGLKDLTEKGPILNSLNIKVFAILELDINLSKFYPLLYLVKSL